MHPSGEAWAAIGHPIAPDKLALAVGSSGSTFTDHGMRWDNSGKNGHYAPISWSSQLMHFVIGGLSMCARPADPRDEDGRGRPRSDPAA